MVTCVTILVDSAFEMSITPAAAHTRTVFIVPINRGVYY